MCSVFNDTATTEIYTLSLHDALPIFPSYKEGKFRRAQRGETGRSLKTQTASLPLLNSRGREAVCVFKDRKSTRLNSSHSSISYAVFCLKKKKTYHCRLATA